MSLSNAAYMCLWNETQGGRGASEIASCIFQLINNEVEFRCMQDVILWSDNCSGQNKNKIILFAYMYMIEIGLVRSVEHKFLQSGHSFLDCDRDFALIEKKKKKTIVHQPTDLYGLIRDARNVPFNVVEMKRFFNFKDGAEYFLNTTKLAISFAVRIKITEPGIVDLKRSFDDGPFEKFNCWKRGTSFLYF